MSTPQSNKVIASAVHASGGIRKSLLTPCRRIGLSRNRKTPNNTPFVSPLETKEITLVNDLSLNAIKINEVQSSENISTTPIVREKKKQQLKDVCDKYKNEIYTENGEQTKLLGNMKEPEDIKIKSLKKNDRKTIKNKRKNDLNGSNQKETSESSKQLKTNIEIKSSSKEDSEYSSDSDIVRISRIKRKITKKNRGKCYILDSDEEEDSPFSGFPSSGSSYEGLIQENSVDNHFEIKKRKKNNSSQENNRVTGNKSVKEKSLVVSNLLQEDGHSVLERDKENDRDNKTRVNDDNILDRKSISGNNNSPLNITPKHIKIIEDEASHIQKSRPKLKSNKEVKRKLSLKKSISSASSLNDDEVLSSTPKEDATTEPFIDIEVIEEIIKLEKTIQDKESQLQKLQQAEIYRKLHKLNDIKSETNTWKIGCQEALQDLLKKLNEHSSIDMVTMLNNLKVPQDMFKYDPENDCFL
ncbi:hypothetical protein Trydic_g18060 [Trypoxylus dichotomus]